MPPTPPQYIDYNCYSRGWECSAKEPKSVAPSLSLVGVEKMPPGTRKQWTETRNSNEACRNQRV